MLCHYDERAGAGPTGKAKIFSEFVMAGLVSAIHVFLFAAAKTWMPGTSPGMTDQDLFRYFAFA